MRVLLAGDVPDPHLEVAVVVGLDEGVDGAHDALLVAVVVVRSAHVFGRDIDRNTNVEAR